jgi:hypothetical protein
MAISRGEMIIPVRYPPPPATIVHPYIDRDASSNMRWVRRAGELEWHGRATRTRIDGALGPIVGTIIAPNSSDLGADGTNRRELISCETLLAGWQWHSHVHSFCNCMQSQLQPQASCFVFNTHSPVLPWPCPAECLHLFVSFMLFSQPSCSPSLDSKNIGGAKPLGAAGGLVVGLQGVLRLSPASEE